MKKDRIRLVPEPPKRGRPPKPPRIEEDIPLSEQIEVSAMIDGREDSHSLLVLNTELIRRLAKLSRLAHQVATDPRAMQRIHELGALAKEDILYLSDK